MNLKSLKKLLYTGTLILTVSVACTACGSSPTNTNTDSQTTIDSTTNSETSSAMEESSSKEELPSKSKEPESVISEDVAEAAEEEIEAEETEEVDGTIIIPETPVSTDPEEIYLDESWEFASSSEIHSGNSVLYKASDDRKDIVIAVNAGHGTSGGESHSTYSHPDQSPKITGGTTAAGKVKSTAISGGMTFHDGTAERDVTLREAQILRDKLLEHGFDVLMIRDGDDTQLDNVARTVIANNNADCHIALHWDGDGLDYDKGCFYCSVPDGIKQMYPVSENWEKHEALGKALIAGLSDAGCKINGDGKMNIDLTQTSYSKIPSVDIELGNAASNHDDETLSKLADGLLAGVMAFFET